MRSKLIVLSGLLAVSACHKSASEVSDQASIDYKGIYKTYAGIESEITLALDNETQSASIQDMLNTEKLQVLTKLETSPGEVKAEAGFDVTADMINKAFEARNIYLSYLTELSSGTNAEIDDVFELITPKAMYRVTLPYPATEGAFHFSFMDPKNPSTKFYLDVEITREEGKTTVTHSMIPYAFGPKDGLIHMEKLDQVASTEGIARLKVLSRKAMANIVTRMNDVETVNEFQASHLAKAIELAKSLGDVDIVEAASQAESAMAAKLPPSK